MNQKQDELKISISAIVEYINGNNAGRSEMKLPLILFIINLRVLYNITIMADVIHVALMIANINDIDAHLSASIDGYILI